MPFATSNPLPASSKSICSASVLACATLLLTVDQHGALAQTPGPKPTAAATTTADDALRKEAQNPVAGIW